MILLKMGKHSDFHLNFFQSLGAMEFYSCHKTDGKFQELYDFQRRYLKIREVCIDFELYFQGSQLGLCTSLKHHIW